MSFVHGKVTVITVDGDAVPGTTSQLKRGADSHDVTLYGKNAHCYAGGLLTGNFTISGIYDNTAMTGPRAVLEPLIGTVIEIIRKPDGTGSGKAQDTFDALLTDYTETSPVAEMVTWSAEFTVSDDVDSTAQSA